jgi:uncharacterized membrane protein YfcA
MPFDLLGYTLAGLVVGTSIGLTGIGGGSMMAPLLILVFHIPAAHAVQLDFLYLVPTKLAGAWQHYRRGTINPSLTTFLALGALPGTILGSLFVSRTVASNPALNGQLRQLIGVFVIVSALLLLGQLAVMWHTGADERGVRGVKFTLGRGLLIAVIGLGVGLFVGATSIGAGSILLPLLVLLLRVHMRELVSTDVAVGALMAIVGATVHSMTQAIQWDLVAALLLGSVPGALLGARLVGIISTRLVRSVVAGALIMSGLILTGVISTTG